MENNEEKEYKEVLNEYFKVSDEINHIEQYKIIKKYLNLKEKQRLLDLKEIELYKQKLLNRYTTCHHILVETHTEAYYDYEGRTYHYYGCIKCGLDEAVIEREYGLNREESMMLEVVKENRLYSIHGKRTGIRCNIYDAREFYKELSEKYPDLDEETMIELFKKNFRNKVKTLKKL